MEIKKHRPALLHRRAVFPRLEESKYEESQMEKEI